MVHCIKAAGSNGLPQSCSSFIKGLSCVVQGQLLWKGPRVRMGLFEGQPTLVAPNAASGRAEYFGPLCDMCVAMPLGQKSLPCI